jgi:ABC-2 type transport system permease protein
MGLGLGLGYGLSTGEWGDLPTHVGGQLSYLPGVLLVASVAVAITAVLPRRSLLAWAVFAFVVLQVMLSQTLRLPAWLDGLSPFWHLPTVPVDSFRAVPAVTELVLAAALVGVALWGYRRRDAAAG